MSTKNNTDNAVYEWAIEQLGKDNHGNIEIKDHRADCAGTLPNLLNSPLAENEQLCLVREVYSKGVRDVAVVTSKGLPKCFASKIIIPQQFHDEVAKFPLCMHSDIAKLA